MGVVGVSCPGSEGPRGDELLNGWVGSILGPMKPNVDPYARGVMRAVKDTERDGGPVVLSRAQWDWLQRATNMAGATTGPQLWPSSPVFGLSVRIKPAKGYPTEIVPRARKKRR